MAEDTTKPHRRLPYILRIVRARPRLATSAVIGLIVIATLPSSWWISTRLLVGWDAGIALYLVLVYTLIARSESGHIRGHALRQDEGRVAILVLTVFAAVASIGAILGELGTGQVTAQVAGQASPRTPAQLALATVTIVLSWAFIHTIFALHYAHDFYSDHHDKKCLNFPGDEAPDYWDFVYFSFVIGMTSQVSDVTVASRPMRHTVAAHGIVSFFFNASLLALTVNIAASVI